MLELIEKILGLISDIISRLGYFGVAGGMFFESACVPIPSEIVLPLAGILVNEGRLTMLGANVAVTVGSMMGSLLAYFAGAYGGRPLILKYGKYILLSNSSFETAERTFNRFGGAAVFFGRLLPIVRTFISLPAGITRMSLKKFCVYSLAGMIPWNAALIWLGYTFGKDYETVIRPIFKRFEYGVAVLLVLCILLFVYKVAHGRKKKLTEI